MGHNIGRKNDLWKTPGNETENEEINDSGKDPSKVQNARMVKEENNYLKNQITGNMKLDRKVMENGKIAKDTIKVTV